MFLEMIMANESADLSWEVYGDIEPGSNSFIQIVTYGVMSYDFPSVHFQIKPRGVKDGGLFVDYPAVPPYIRVTFRSQNA